MSEMMLSRQAHSALPVHVSRKLLRFPPEVSLLLKEVAGGCSFLAFPVFLGTHSGQPGGACLRSCRPGAGREAKGERRVTAEQGRKQLGCVPSQTVSRGEPQLPVPGPHFQFTSEHSHTAETNSSA